MITNAEGWTTNGFASATVEFDEVDRIEALIVDLNGVPCGKWGPARDD